MTSSATVFNLDQVEGLDLDGDTEIASDVDPIETAEELVAGYLASGPTLRHAGDRAFYVPASDAITIPHRSAFESAAAYYSTLFHEIGHSTGHGSRLARDLSPLGGVHSYAREELVAEFAAAFLRAHAGIDDDREIEQSAAYVKGWAAKIRDEPKLLTWAASQAQKAVDHVLAKRTEIAGAAAA